MKTILFVEQPGDIDTASTLLNDLIVREDTYTVYVGAKPKNRLKSILKKVHLSRKINKVVKLPFKEKWFDLNKLETMVKDDTVFLFPNFSLARDIPITVLRKIRKKWPNNRMVVVVLDSLHSHSQSNPYTIEKLKSFNWDLIMSFDEEDCKEFGFKFIGNCYYSVLSATTPLKRESDIVYVGRQHVGDIRTTLIEKIYNKIGKNIKCDFTLVGGENVLNGIKHRTTPISYEDLLTKIRKSNCVLELLQEGQHQQTIRPFEAVVYNKKLLTNNPRIKEFEFYDPKYMRYFKDVDDIDEGWLKDSEPVNYHYNNEFSPIHLLELIDTYLD